MMWVEIICLLPAPKVLAALMCILSFKERTWERIILAPPGQEKADMSRIKSGRLGRRYAATSIITMIVGREIIASTILMQKRS